MYHPLNRGLLRCCLPPRLCVSIKRDHGAPCGMPQSAPQRKNRAWKSNLITDDLIADEALLFMSGPLGR